jgi:hypothetical protein
MAHLPESALQEFAAFLGDRATNARGLREAHGKSEAYHAVEPPDLVVSPCPRRKCSAS